VRVLAGENLAGDHVWLRVRDNGPGMPPELRERIFDPFYTSKQGGTGLGLALTRKIVEAHGGQLELGSTPGDATQFVVTLPRRARAPLEGR
jgi:signal transduction histidine kinase